MRAPKVFFFAERVFARVHHPTPTGLGPTMGEGSRQATHVLPKRIHPRSIHNRGLQRPTRTSGRRDSTKWCSANLLKHDAICDKVFVPHKAHVHLTQEKFSVRDVDSNANNRCRPLPTDAASPRRAILRAQRVQDLRKHGRATVLDHRSPVSVLALCPVRVEPHGEGRVGARLGWIAEW